jgi:hypothetical protein
VPGLNHNLEKALTLTFLAFSFAPPTAAAGAQSPEAPASNDQGTFVISYAGKEIGTEKFSIRSSSKEVRAEGEISLHYTDNGKKVDVETTPKLVLSPSLEPLAYTWDEKSPESNHLEVDFRSSPARSTLKKSDGKLDVREFKFAPNLVVLDDNVVHHYELLAWRYLGTSGGLRPFTGYIPQEALPGGLAVNEVEMGDLKGHEKKNKLRHLIVTTDNSRVDVWVGSSGRVERVSFPSAQLEYMRKK